jgi:hypothetical protein
MRGKYLHRFSRLLGQYANARTGPHILALFRMAYSFAAILVALRTYGQASFLWHSNHWSYKIGTCFLLPTLIALLLCILVGFGGRIVIILHCLILAWLNLSFPMVGYLDFRFNQAAAFWMVFMRLNKVWSVDALIFKERMRRAPQPPAWPVHFLGLSLGLWMLDAGLLKSADPLWRDGVGFYYSFLLPWVKQPYLNFMLNYPLLLRVINYGTIVLEISVIFLYIFRETRWISIVLAALFFANLIFVLRLDPVGQFGLAWCIALLSVTPFPLGINDLIAKFGWRAGELSEKVPESSGWLFTLRKSFILFMAAFITYVLVLLHMPYLNSLYFNQNKITVVLYPCGLLEGTMDARETEPFIMKRVKAGLFRLSGPLRILERPAYFINRITTCFEFNALFGLNHQLGIYLFRVEVEMDDDTRLEPMAVFKEDMTGGAYSYGLFTPRYIQGAMYGISLMCHRLNMKPGYTLSPTEFDLLQRVIGSSIAQLDQDQIRHMKRAVLKVRPILVPPRYAGDVKVWDSRGWTDFYVYERATGQYKIQSVPDPYPLRQPLKTIRNGWVVLAP